MSKYATLGEFLLTSVKDRVSLSFSDIESVLSFPLPKSARKFRTWWANDKTHSHAKFGWLDYGWRVIEVDLGNQIIHFRRVAALRLARSKSSQEVSDEAPLSTLHRVRQFETKARELLSQYFKSKLRPGMFPGISKLFDYVSQDKDIVGEAKYLSLGKARIQPAKFASISEAVWLLEKIRARHKFLIFGSTKVIPLKWLQRYGSLLKNISFYFWDETRDLEVLTASSEDN
ncbi:MAG: hypothetical protein ACFFCO_11450 [Promethearchaeota archaeon]